MPLAAPTFLTPAANAWLLRTAVTTVNVRAYYSAAQVNAQTLEYSTNGGGSWSATGVTWVGPWVPVGEPTPGIESAFTIAASTFADEATIQLRTRYQAKTTFEWSPYTYLNLRAADAPAAPTITVPATNGTTVSKNVTVSWTSAEAQSGYELEVRTATGGGGTLVYSAGNYDSTVQSVTAPMDITAVTRYIRVRTHYNGLVGAWAERSVSVVFTLPATPTFTTSKIDPNGFGILDTILFSITNPTPSGGQPAVTAMSVYYRKQGSSDPWVVIDIGMTAPYRWRAPHGSWEFMVGAYAASLGTFSTSAVGQPQTVTLKGVLLNLASTPLTGMWMLFNGDEAEEAYEIESALIQYVGRSFPVVEFGSNASNSIEVSSVSLKTRDELLRLQAMLLARDVVLYRDRRGRRVYGRLTLTSAKDTIYGYEIGLLVDRLDYANPAEIGPN